MRPRAGEAAALSPVLSWKTQVTGVRALLPGDAAGYNGTFTAERPTRLALLAAGYADGLSRSLSNRFDVLILGQRARIAGRISMDQAMVDVTDIAGVRAGDEAVLIGSQGMESISAYDHADATGSIVWEVTCDIGGRARRVAV
jgi:alanine racemase